VFDLGEAASLGHPNPEVSVLHQFEATQPTISLSVGALRQSLSTGIPGKTWNESSNPKSKIVNS
jgi:hypothetical protein